MVKKADYKRLDKVDFVHVHVVEIITDPERKAELEDCLETLRQYSAACVVEEFIVAGTFGENADILDKRAVRR